MARRNDGPNAVFLENAPCRHADGHDGGLGVFGEAQLLLGALETQPGNCKSKGLIGLCKRVGGDRKTLLELASHAYRLGTLSGKKKSDLRIHCKGILSCAPR